MTGILWYEVFESLAVMFMFVKSRSLFEGITTSRALVFAHFAVYFHMTVEPRYRVEAFSTCWADFVSILQVFGADMTLQLVFELKSLATGCTQVFHTNGLVLVNCTDVVPERVLAPAGVGADSVVAVHQERLRLLNISTPTLPLVFP